MRILLATIGTRGDVEPHLALALRVRAAGHEVAIATAPRFAPMLAAHGVPLLPLDEGLLELLDSAAGRALFADLDSVLGMLKTVPKVLRQVGPIHHRLVADAWAATETFRPDVIVYHPKLFCMPAFAARRGIPALLALFVPMLVPTATAPLPGFPDLPLGPIYRRLTWQLLRTAMRWGSAPFLKPWRRRHDPDGLARAADALQLGPGRPVPVLHACSAAVCPPPADWPPEACMTGWWFLPESPWSPPPALADFLAAGAPPVYIGFGSMAGVDPRATTRIVLAAVQRAGVRALLATGWGGLGDADLPPTVFRLEQAPHAALFPRMAAVVHHGGAGTTGAGLRAGKPSVICPFGVDQPYWGARVHALGAGPPPIPQRRLTIERLAEALQCAVQDPAMRERAEALGRAIRAEDGTGVALARIEQLVRSGPD
ncbi:MAG: glycosyltransferase [Xanthomonadales bacterium]|jgi:sterol 3beta-glucosyltransferase|nr:glycosyltransferase [Xanthomonadales bacterium]